MCMTDLINNSNKDDIIIICIGALRNKVKGQLVCLDTHRDKVTAIQLIQTLVCFMTVPTYLYNL